MIYPGGSYSCYGETEQHPIARFYYEHGYNAFIVYYRVQPYRYPAALLDAQRAVKTVRCHAAEWGVDPRRVFTMGFSAGGHLCGCVAALPDICTLVGDAVDGMEARPTGALLGYPVIVAEPRLGHADSFRNLLGERYEQQRESLSLEKRVGKDTCPCFLWHTLADEGVPAYNSLVFTQALQQNGVPAELHLFQEGGHGLGLAVGVPGACQWPQLSLDWMARVAGP